MIKQILKRLALLSAVFFTGIGLIFIGGKIRDGVISPPAINIPDDAV